MSKPLGITQDQIGFAGSQTAFTSPALLNELLKDKEAMVKSLGDQVVPVTADKLSVDEFGRLVVDDASFAVALRDKLSKLAPGHALDNSVCNGGGCSKV